MQQANKLFTIIIPTYNRCEMLKESLEIAIPQVRKFKEDVSLYISDNASTDNTKDVVDKYLKENQDVLSYYRHQENVGGQNNFRHAVRAVDSEYVCLLGDDDILFPNFVETIVNLLKENEEVGVINYNVMSVNYKLNNACLRERNIKKLSTTIYPSGKEFIYEHLRIPSLVSSNVFHRKQFIEQIDKIPVGTYPGYDWMAVLYNSCLSHKCIFVGWPLLLQRYPQEQRWAIDAPWFYIYGFGRLFKDLDSQIPGLYEHWIEHSHKENYGMMNYLLQIVSQNKELYKERFDIMRPYMGTQEYETLFRLHLYHSQSYIEFKKSPLRYIYYKTVGKIRKLFS